MTPTNKSQGRGGWYVARLGESREKCRQMCNTWSLGENETPRLDLSSCYAVVQKSCHDDIVVGQIICSSILIVQND